MTIQLIISDIDGCISPEESRAWDWAAFARFVSLCRDAAAGQGPIAPLTLCTGRPQPYVEVLMKVLDIRAPAICESGAVLYSLPDNTSRFGPGVTPEKIRGLHAVRDYILTDIFPNFPQLVYQFGKEAQMSLFCAEPDCFPEVAERIRVYADTIPGLDLHITPSHYYLNIDLAGVTKGRAIARLVEDLGLHRDQLAGIGDTVGDLSIREAVAFFACPANAVPAVQAVVDYVSPYKDIEGVLDILARPEMRRG